MLIGLRADIERWGYPAALYKKTMELAARAGLRVYRINVRRIVLGPEPPFEALGFTFRLLTAAEARDMADDPDLNISLRFIEGALANGDVCIGAFEDNYLVAYAWRAMKTAPHTPRLQVEVRAPGRYGYNAFTRQAYRGRGIWPVLAPVADHEFVRAGRCVAVSFTESHNLASIAADKKIGNVWIGLAGCLSVGHKLWLFHTPGVKERGFRFVRIDQPEDG